MSELQEVLGMPEGLFYGLDLRGARLGQKKGIETAIGLYQQGLTVVTAVMPPGYGKSDFIRGVAVAGYNAGLWCTSMALSPRILLCDQLDHSDHWAKFLQRFRPHLVTGDKIPHKKIIRASLNYQQGIEDRNIIFLSAVQQFVEAHLDNFLKWAESRKHHGKPVLVIVDETHMSSTENRWGEVVCALRKAGALVLAVTGTPIRGDKEGIECFSAELQKVISIEEIHRVPAADPLFVRIKHLHGEKYEYRLRPHIEVKFKEAWEEGAICEPFFHPFNVQLSWVKGQEEDKRWLHELSKNETYKVLGRVVRSPVVIEQGCWKALDLLEELTERVRKASQHKGQEPSAQELPALIIFCGQDRAQNQSQEDQHLAQIRTILKRVARAHPFWSVHSLKIIVATSTNDRYGIDEDGTKALQRFCAGEGNVCLVKQMASMGMDAPRTKVVLDLSPARGLGWWIQRIMRAGRPCGILREMHIVCLFDVLIQELWDLFREEFPLKAESKQLQLTKEYDVLKKERSEESLEALATQPVYVEDRPGDRMSAAEYKEVTTFFTDFPSLGALPIAERKKLLDRIRAGAVPPAAPGSPAASGVAKAVNMTKTLRELRDECLACHKDLVIQRIKSGGLHYSKELFKELAPGVWREAMKRCGPYFDFSSCEDDTLLERFSKTLREMQVQETKIQEMPFFVKEKA